VVVLLVRKFLTVCEISKFFTVLIRDLHYLVISAT